MLWIDNVHKRRAGHDDQLYSSLLEQFFHRCSKWSCIWYQLFWILTCATIECNWAAYCPPELTWKESTFLTLCPSILLLTPVKTSKHHWNNSSSFVDWNDSLSFYWLKWLPFIRWLKQTPHHLLIETTSRHWLIDSHSGWNSTAMVHPDAIQHCYIVTSGSAAALPLATEVETSNS